MNLASPHYFGPTERRRFGFLHWPADAPRGAVLICPPLAYEEVCAHQTLRQLAESSCDHGLVALRMDYDGTGNAAGTARDPERVAAWQQSIRDGIAELVRIGFPSVSVVALRFAATMLGSLVPAEPAVHALVLWDPVMSGRRYARGLRLLGSQVAERDGVAVGGIEFSDETLQSIAKVSLDLGTLGRPALMIVRAEPGAERATDPADAVPGVVTEALEGTVAMLETDAELAVVPQAIVRRIVAWLDDHPLASPPIVSRPEPSDTSVETVGAVRVRHVAERVGEHRLFAVQSALDGTAPDAAIVMLNNGVAAQIGPGRAWVDFARDFTLDGWWVWRVDLSGLGDSPPRAGRAEHDSYPAVAGDDIADIVAALRSRGVHRVVLMGMCSGALLALDGSVATDIDLVVGINGRFDKPFCDRRTDRARRAAGPTNRMLGVPLSKVRLLPVLDRLPAVLWSALDRLHLAALPVRGLERALAAGTQVTLIFGSDEHGLRALRRRAPRRFAALTSTPGFDVTEIPGLDHSMFQLDGRARVAPIARARLQSVLDDDQTPSLMNQCRREQQIS